MTIIEQIKAEIERLYDGEAPKHDQQCNFDDGYFVGIDAIAQFLDTLESERPVPNDLEEAADKYAEKLTSEPYLQIVHKTDFIAGANWQKEQDDKLVDTIYQQGIEKGKDDMKEQMMKEAKEVRVQTSPLNGPLGISAYCCNFPSEHPFYHCKEGDKVRIILVKEN